ncbi:hypothetical protein FJY93_00890 [Candidatus Kaiserbacteria bacterium]|nr:hypothetical protein [Candidatus Kaiserbacteria bacterium]
MGKRGPKPKKILSEEWSSHLAYAIGLLASDGCLSAPSHGYLIDLTSKDREQLENFITCLGVPFKITRKLGGNGKGYLRVQFKNITFYTFLISVGLTPAKSKTIGALNIPDAYFFDFLRGLFDGDGSTYSYWDKRWRSSFMFYLTFVSASPLFINWLRENIARLSGARGHISGAKRGVLYQLRYAKKDALVILKKMYKKKEVVCLRRKRLKIEEMLRIVGESL